MNYWEKPLVEGQLACKRCGGYGSVPHYVGVKNISYDGDSPCPVCNGNGLEPKAPVRSGSARFPQASDRATGRRS